MKCVQSRNTGSVRGEAASLLPTLVLGKLLILGLADLVFLRCWFIWPSAMIWDFGRCFLKIDTDRPGQVAKNPLCIAWSHVYTTGYPTAACRNATRYCAVFTAIVLIARLAICGADRGTACTGTVHSPFAVWGTCMMSLLLWWILTDCQLNVEMQPESHIWPMETNNTILRVGKMWAWRAAGGKPEMGIVPVCVDIIFLPSGSCTWIGSLAVWTASHGLSILKKWTLNPVSAIALCMAGVDRELLGEELKVLLTSLLINFKLFCLCSVFFKDTPRIRSWSRMWCRRDGWQRYQRQCVLVSCICSWCCCG